MRTFSKSGGESGWRRQAGGPLSLPRAAAKPHLVIFSFDDGFRKSFTRTAAIYEKFKLSACFNVLAEGFPDPGYVGEYTPNAPWGDFVLLNELQRRGHEVMPHGWRHENLQKLPLAAGQDLVRRCLDTFAEKLEGFAARRAVFNFPYNALTPELEQWLPTQVRAFRTGGAPVNALPHAGQVKLTCISFGPGNAEAALDGAIAGLLARESGWLIFNTRGLDEEGWGKDEAVYQRLKQRPRMPGFNLWPAGGGEEGRKMSHAWAVSGRKSTKIESPISSVVVPRRHAQADRGARLGRGPP